MNLYIACVNYRYGENAFLPYAGARLWAYAQAQPLIAANWELCKLLWEREPVLAVVERMRAAPPDCFAVSTYIWNESYNLALIEAVCEAFPSCVVVAGGPQVPENEDDAWTWGATHDIDYVIRGEGEKRFAEILVSAVFEEYLAPVPPKERIDNLAELPSPYLTGVLDGLVRSRPDVKWQALQETSRGCPYACTFCDWGSSTYDKVRKFPSAVPVAELEWFAEHKIELLYNCDANFGMLPEDEGFTEELIRTSLRTGYPQKFRAAYAKKINERVFSVAQAISDAGLSKGATISFQSMQEETLKAVKRLNPVAKTLAETFDRYNKAHISTYTELIVGLPGETLGSFKDGIDQLLTAGQHYGINVYPCMALRNSEMSKLAYREAWGIKTRRVRLLLSHGVQAEDDIPEWYELVTSTKDMSYADWREAWTFGIVVQALHCSGLFTQGAKDFVAHGGTYRDYYEGMIYTARLRTAELTALGVALRWWETILNDAVRGFPWRTKLPLFGDVEWPPEEAMRLIVSQELDVIPKNVNLSEWARDEVWYSRKGGAQKEREAA